MWTISINFIEDLLICPVRKIEREVSEKKTCTNTDNADFLGLLPVSELFFQRMQRWMIVVIGGNGWVLVYGCGCY
jgi:hypothetical protein